MMLMSKCEPALKHVTLASSHFTLLFCTERTAKKCTKIYNARAEPLFCSLNLLFGDAFVARRRRGLLKLHIEILVSDD